MKLGKVVLVISVCFAISIIYTLNNISDRNNNTNEDTKIETIKEKKVYNEITRYNGLKIIKPNFSKLDLICDSIPSKKDSSVILVAAAAYTGEYLTQFKHSNIAGDHVSNGKRYRGYRCTRNTGAFVYYNDKWKFCYKRYSNELDSAALYGGAAFAQELIINNNEILQTPREDNSKNVFRALCELSGNLCIIESDSITTFGNFKSRLKEANVANAIYMDMGEGWNYTWYRTAEGIVEPFPKTHNYCTNWIVFYEE